MDMCVNIDLQFVLTRKLKPCWVYLCESNLSSHDYYMLEKLVKMEKQKEHTKGKNQYNSWHL